MNIFTGNLSADVTESDLRKAFCAYGEVTFVNIVKDRTGRISRGFGILGMPDRPEAEAAIKGMDGTLIKGQSIVVHEAKPPSA